MTLKQFIYLLILGISLVGNVVLGNYYQQNEQVKQTLKELSQKQSQTASLALNSLYADSINNELKRWLNNDTKDE